MKHFIYFDDRLLASYYAQAYGGLTTQKQEVVGDGTSNTTTDGTNCIRSRINGSANFLVAKATGEISAEVGSPVASFTENQLAQELITSTMHDNIFDKVVEHAKDNNLIVNDSPSICDYMHITLPLKIANLDALIQKYKGEVFLTGLKKSFYDTAFNETDAENHNMTPANWMKERERVAVRIAEQKHKKFINDVDIIRGMLEVVPIKQFLYGEFHSRQLIIPIKEPNLREPIDYITTFMAGNIQIFGRVSRLGLSSSLEGNLANLNKPLEQYAQNTIKELCGMPIDDETIILFPMAIYFQ